MKSISMRNFLLFSLLAAVASCGSSVTNVWDYYIKNEVEKHVEGATTSSRSKLLYRNQESVNKAQLEFIAYVQDSNHYLVIGSHKVAKAFYIHDSLYHFDVNNLYSSVRGDDFIRQLGDLSIYFTHVPVQNCVAFLANWEALKLKYTQASPAEGTTMYIDYAISPNVFVSFPKSSLAQKQDQCIVWVGKRKHEMFTGDLIKAMNDAKSF